MQRKKIILLVAATAWLGAYMAPPKKRTPSVRAAYTQKHPLFVVQKHVATHTHFDLRLEIDGVLKSWAIPKGPSLNPSEKRLAVLVEDHPLDYAEFEGVLPKGSRGAGPVMVWDTGAIENIKKKDDNLIPLDTAFKNGSLEIILHGQRLQGKYALVRMYATGDQWLLIKMQDDHARARKNLVRLYNNSVLTGRTMAQIVRDHKKASA